MCLHPLFDKAGSQNKAKIARCVSDVNFTDCMWLTLYRKLIQCALSRQDYAAAREAFNKMSGAGKDEPATRYLMYKVGVQSGDMDLGLYRIAL